MTGYDEAVPAGRDLTAQDVDEAILTTVRPPGGRALQSIADYLNGITRPSEGVGHPVGVSEAQPDEHRDWVPGVGRHDPMSQPPDEWLDTGPYPGGGEGIKGPDDLAPRSWSLPAPPPDDVTVVHLVTPTGNTITLWRKRPDGKSWEFIDPDGDPDSMSWSYALSKGTVVEGEPPAPEPQEPPRFAIGDRVRGKNTGRLGTVDASPAKGSYPVWFDGARFREWIDCYALEPAPEPQEQPRFECGQDVPARFGATPESSASNLRELLGCLWRHEMSVEDAAWLIERAERPVSPSHNFPEED